MAVTLLLQRELAARALAEISGMRRADDIRRAPWRTFPDTTPTEQRVFAYLRRDGIAMRSLTDLITLRCDAYADSDTPARGMHSEARQRKEQRAAMGDPPSAKDYNILLLLRKRCRALGVG